MKLKLWLLLLCLLGVGMFSYAQNRKKEAKPTVEDGPDAIPVVVKSSKKHRKPPPPPVLGKDGKPFAPPKVEMVHFKAPPPPPKPADAKAEVQFDKDGNRLTPPPPPPPKIEKIHFKAPKVKAEKPVKPDAPPPADFRG